MAHRVCHARRRAVMLAGCSVLFASWSVFGAALPYAWQEQISLSPKPPSYQGSILMAYDSVRQVSVLLHTDEYKGTWLWNGTAWSQPATDSYPRSPAMMTFDSHRGVCVVYQPSGNTAASGSTWEWNGTSWRQVSSDGPDSRREGAMVYDAGRRRTLLFGGRFDTLSCSWPAYTWEWDGSQWRVVSQEGPPRRSDCAMAFDAKRGVVVLFGGVDCNQMQLGSTWTWDGNRWTLASTSGPLARTSHAMIYDSFRERVLLFGGYNVEGSIGGVDGLNDLWEWDGTTWTEATSPGPIRRYDFSMCYDTARRSSVIFGGWRRNEFGSPVLLDDTWLLDVPALWVDYAYNATLKTGDFATPFNTLAEAVGQAIPSSFIKLKPGLGREIITVTKPLFLEAPLGPVIIGQ